jgi:hypothetical protein
MSVDITNPMNLISRRTYLDYVYYTDESLKSPKFEAFIDSFPQSSIISLLLIYEKHRCDAIGSYFNVYVRELQRRYSNKTIFQVKSDIWEEFQDSMVKKRAKEFFKKVKQSYQEVMEHEVYSYLIFPNECNTTWKNILTLEEFQWGYAMANSRAMKIEDNEFGLIPVMDFVNHLEKKNAQLDGGSLKSTILILKGEEIGVEYLNLNNFFLNYYFCNSESSNIPYEFEFKEIQGFLLKKLKVSNIVQLSKDSTLKDIPPLLWGIQHYLFTKDVVLLEELENGTYEMKNHWKGSIESMRNLFLGKLKNYKTSLEEDLLLLENSHGDSRCAIVIRKDEKMILKKFIYLFEENLK